MNEFGLYEIYGLSYVPFWQRTWFLGLIMVVMVCGCSYIIIRCVRWYYRKHATALTYWQVALKQLEDLKRNNIATVMQGPFFYVRLTYILKEYIQNRYNIVMTGRTDKEALAILVQEKFDPQFLAMLEIIFQGGEYIKFANVSAAQHQIEKDLESSVLFIKATQPDLNSKS